MDAQSDREDVDVFVSPKHFVGRTPSAAMTRKKVFAEAEEEEQKRKESTAGDSTNSNANFALQGIKYEYGSERSEVPIDVHKAISVESKTRKIARFANYLKAVIGACLIVSAIWTLLAQRNGGISAYLSAKGFLLKSPVLMGLFLFMAGLCTIVPGIIIGVREMVDSLNLSIQNEDQRKSFFVYEVLTVVSIVFATLVMVSVMQPLHSAYNNGINRSTWEIMAVSFPDRLCSYELSNKCAGSRNQTCSIPLASGRDRSCPGHYCIDTCKVISKRPETKKSCAGCLSSSSSNFEKCKTGESKKANSDNCLDMLRADIRHFLLVVAICSSIGIVFNLLITLFAAARTLLINRPG